MESKNKITEPSAVDSEEDEDECKTMVRPKGTVISTQDLKPLSTTIKKQQGTENMTYHLTQGKTLLAMAIKDEFPEIFAKYGEDAILQATARQIINFSQDKNPLALGNEEEINQFLAKYSDNFKINENIQILGKGGEAIVFGVTPYKPMEVIAKVPLVTGDNLEVFAGLLQENHFLKLIEHKDYICKVLEEVATYNKENDSILGMVALIESAKNDLSKVIKIWQDEQSAIKKVEFFSERKLAYFCIKSMEALAYLNTNNIYFGDMKPENLLLFKDYRIKLGDLGVSLKIPDDFTPDSEIYLKGLTPKYSLEELGEKYNKDQPVTVKDLYCNDNYSLMRTFQQIYDQCSSSGFQISADSYFNLMLEDLKRYEEPLIPKVLKWQKVFAEDYSFIYGLCDELLQEDKIYALPQVLRLSKFRNFVDSFENKRSSLYPNNLVYQNSVQQKHMVEMKNIENNDFYYAYETGIPTNAEIPKNQLKKVINYYLQQFYKYDITYQEMYQFFIDNYTNLFEIKENDMVITSEGYKGTQIRIEQPEDYKDYFELIKDKYLDEFEQFCKFQVMVQNVLNSSKLNYTYVHARNLTRASEKVNPALMAEIIIKYLQTQKDCGTYLNDESRIFDYFKKLLAVASKDPSYKSQLYRAFLVYNLVATNYYQYEKKVVTYTAGFDYYKKLVNETYPQLKVDKKEKYRLHQEMKHFWKLKNTTDLNQQIVHIKNRLQLLSEHLRQDEPEILECYLNMGMIYEKLQDDEKALFCYEKYACYTCKSDSLRSFLFACCMSYKLGKIDKLSQIIHLTRRFSIVHEALLLNYYDYPYQQSQEDQDKALQMITREGAYKQFVGKDSEYAICMVIKNYFEHFGKHIESNDLKYVNSMNLYIQNKRVNEEIGPFAAEIRKAIKEGRYKEYLHSIKDQIMKMEPERYDLNKFQEKVETYYHMHPLTLDKEPAKKCEHVVISAAKNPRFVDSFYRTIYQCKECDLYMCKACLEICFTQQNFMIGTKFGTYIA